MPTGTCDPASRGDQWNGFDTEQHIGDGVVRCWGEYGWDGVSVMPNCDGPINSLNVSNTGTATAYVLLPNKRKGDPWVAIPPGTNTSIGPGQRNQLGLENRSDIIGLRLSLTPGG